MAFWSRATKLLLLLAWLGFLLLFRKKIRCYMLDELIKRVHAIKNASCEISFMKTILRIQKCKYTQVFIYQSQKIHTLSDSNFATISNFCATFCYRYRCYPFCKMYIIIENRDFVFHTNRRLTILSKVVDFSVFEFFMWKTSFLSSGKHEDVMMMTMTDYLGLQLMYITYLCTSYQRNMLKLVVWSGHHYQNLQISSSLESTLLIHRV